MHSDAGPQEWVLIHEVPGMLEAEILRGMLEANGIQVMLSHESAGTAIGLAAGPLGWVKIRVPVTLEAEARQLIDDYRSGKLAAED